MAWLPLRSSKTRSSRAGRAARRARATFLPQARELEGRTLLSTLTVVTDRDSGPGSLPADIAAAGSGDTIAFAPGLAGHTIFLASPLSFTGGLSLDGSRA
jgi:hypothetical protein